jgi:AraC-like DNA-binding protein
MSKENYYKYFPLSKVDKSWGLYVLDCGSVYDTATDQSKTVNVDHPNKYRFNWRDGRVLNEFQLIYIVEGLGYFESKDCQLNELTTGMILLLEPGIWHRYKPNKDRPWNTFWIGFDGEVARSVIPKLKLSPERPFRNIGHQETMEEIFQEIIHHSKKEITGYQQIMAGELMRLVGWVHAISKRSNFREQGVDSMLDRAKYMLRYPKNYPSMEAVADSLNLGYSKFRKLFKEYTGISPGQFRMQHQIRQATELLATSSLSIQQISDQLGFESTQYFSRILKKKTGRTPGSYRKPSLQGM